MTNSFQDGADKKASDRWETNVPRRSFRRRKVGAVSLVHLGPDPEAVPGEADPRFRLGVSLLVAAGEDPVFECDSGGTPMREAVDF